MKTKKMNLVLAGAAMVILTWGAPIALAQVAGYDSSSAGRAANSNINHTTQGGASDDSSNDSTTGRGGTAMGTANANSGTDTSGNAVHASNGISYRGTSDDTTANGSTASGGAGVNGGVASTDSDVAPAGGTAMRTTTTDTRAAETGAAANAATRTDTATSDDRLAQQQQQQRVGDDARTGMPGWAWAVFALIVVSGVWYSIRYTNHHHRGRPRV